MLNFIEHYKYIVVPFAIWLGIQIFKVITELVKTKKIDFKRLMGAGGMPSSHSAVVCSLATMVGRNEGVESPIFGVALIFAFIVMYDAAGVRRAAGKQASLLNKIIETPGLTGVQVTERLVEVLGHSPNQVFVGALVGIIIGMLF